MFERVGEDARAALVAATQESKQTGDSHVQTDHLLIALLRAQDETTAILNAAGVTLPRCRQVLLERRPDTLQTPSEYTPFAPDLKATLELALHDANRRGDAEIGNAHLLRALLSVGGTARELLLAVGSDPTAIHLTVHKSVRRNRGRRH